MTEHKQTFLLETVLSDNVPGKFLWKQNFLATFPGRHQRSPTSPERPVKVPAQRFFKSSWGRRENSTHCRPQDVFTQRLQNDNKTFQGRCRDVILLAGLDNGFSSRVACDLPLYVVHQRRLHKCFYTTQHTIKFLMFLILTRLLFKWANAKSRIPRHAQWRIDVFVNVVIISVISVKFVSYLSPKHHDTMITSHHYHLVNMVVIQTAIRPMFIHLCLLSVLKSTHSFIIIGVYSTYQYQEDEIYSWRNPGNYFKSTHQ